MVSILLLATLCKYGLLYFFCASQIRSICELQTTSPALYALRRVRLQWDCFTQKRTIFTTEYQIYAGKPKAPLWLLLAFFIFDIFRPDSAKPDIGDARVCHFICLLKPFLLPLKSNFVEKIQKRNKSLAWRRGPTRCRSPPLLKSWFCVSSDFRRKWGNPRVYTIFSEKRPSQ